MGRQNPYAGQKRYRSLAEFAGLQDDGGETSISLYEDVMENDRAYVVVEALSPKGNSRGYKAYDGTVSQMQGEYDRQIMEWRKSETRKAIAKAREAGVYDEFEQ